MITESGHILTPPAYDIRAAIQNFKDWAAYYRRKRLALRRQLLFA